MSVSDWFQAFHSNLAITNEGDISNRYKRITQRLNTDFRDTTSDTANSIYVGSYGRDTAIGKISDLGISTFASTLLLGVIFYTKDFDLGAVAEQHKRTADELWLIREQLVSLLTDIEAGIVAPEGIAKRRDVLIDQLDTVYSTARVTSYPAYAAAQNALKNKEDLTFSVEEIDVMLQPTLRKGDKPKT
jgi:hypothetical protein